MSDNDRQTPETDAALAAAEAKIKEISKRATNVDGIIDAIIEGMEVLVAAAYRMERQRDEARAEAHGYRASYDGAEEACRVWKARTAEAHHEMAAWRETVLDLRVAIGRLDADLDKEHEARLQAEQAARLAMEEARRLKDAYDAQSPEERATARAEKAEASLAVARVELDATRACADKADAELAELRSLWACEEPVRQRAVEAWRKATGSQGDPSVGALLAWAARKGGEG